MALEADISRSEQALKDAPQLKAGIEKRWTRSELWYTLIAMANEKMTQPWGCNNDYLLRESIAMLMSLDTDSKSIVFAVYYTERYGYKASASSIDAYMGYAVGFANSYEDALAAEQALNSRL